MINRIGIIGIVLAIVAIGIAIFQDGIRENIGFNGTSEKIEVIRKGITIFSSAKSEPKRDYVDYAYMGIGFLALIFGVISFLQKESYRVSGMATALGLVAIAWHYVLIGVVFAVVILAIANMA